MTEERVRGPKTYAVIESRNCWEALYLLVVLTKIGAENELSDLCSKAGCSWEESYKLHDQRLITIRMDEAEKRVYASITPGGEAFARWFEQEEEAIRGYLAT